MVTLEGKLKVGTSKMPSDLRALTAGFFLKDGKDLTSQSYGEMRTTKTVAVRMDP